MNDLTVLLVDDEEHILNTFCMILERAGYEKIEAMSDSRHAIPFLSEHQKAIVVLDLLMPHLSGSELLLQIRADFPDRGRMVVQLGDVMDTKRMNTTLIPMKI